jgi:hypothetical protein
MDYVDSHKLEVVNYINGLIIITDLLNNKIDHKEYNHRYKLVRDELDDSI